MSTASDVLVYTLRFSGMADEAFVADHCPAGCVLALYGPPIFNLGGWLTGAVLIAFALAGRQVVLKEGKLEEK